VSTYNAGSWSDEEIATSLNAGNNASILAAKCTSVSFCVVGGTYTSIGSNYETFVSVFNGTTWVDNEVAGLLNTGGYGNISSISCVSATFCVAGGTYRTAGNEFHAFASLFDGVSWVDQPVDLGLPSTNDNQTQTLSCAAVNFCVAAGRYSTAGGNEAFVSTYNGTSWSAQTVGTTLNSGHSAYINSVSCVSNSFCLAGGAYRDAGTNDRAFVSTFDGTAWSDLAISDSGNTWGHSAIYEVSCFSSSLCQAAGSFTIGSRTSALVSTAQAVSPPVNQTRAVYFADNSSRLTQHAKSLLNAFATYCVAQRLSWVDLNAYTDPRGTIALNKKLASDRNKSVKSYLKTKFSSLGVNSVFFTQHSHIKVRFGSNLALSRKVTFTGAYWH
jgi:hypothetical protein